MKQNYSLQENNISLITITKEDLQILRTWRNKEHIREMFLNNKEINEFQQTEWFTKYLTKKNDYMFIIIYENIQVGTLALYNITDNKTAEFGRFMIGEEIAKGKGIAKEAMKIICNWGFKEFNLKNITLEVFINNNRAIKIYKQLGFQIKDIIQKNNKSLYEMVLYATN
jgi:UDP-4-amino-4,6-dideoxy-N-acetyl-beta-L-altrosamine N-acetyltransferase